MLRLVIDGNAVTLISVDQGGVRLQPNEVTITDGRIVAVFNAVGVRFEGNLSGDRHIDGIFTQGQAIPIRLTRGEIAEPTIWPPVNRERLNARRIAASVPALGCAWSSGRHSGVLVTGTRSSADEVAAQTDDQWHWGSITKSMTATLCARLVEAGVIHWDMTIGQVLDAPGVQVPPAYRDATFLHLLSHRAGLQPNISDVGFSPELKDAREERLKYARAALEQKPIGAIGAQMGYSNNGYIVAGAMIEKLAGKSWESLIQTEVFAPLGITHAGQGAPGHAGKVDQPLGHTVVKGEHVPIAVGTPDSDNVAALGPAGRVHMPLADMMLYLKAHRDRPAKFLKGDSWEQLHTPHFKDNYALGWYVRNDGSLWHSGSNTIWCAEVLVDAKADLVCAACANDATIDTKGAVNDTLMSARAAAVA